MTYVLKPRSPSYLDRWYLHLLATAPRVRFSVVATPFYTIKVLDKAKTPTFVFDQNWQISWSVIQSLLMCDQIYPKFWTVNA